MKSLPPFFLPLAPSPPNKGIAMYLPGSKKVVCEVQACDASIKIGNPMYQHPGGAKFASELEGWTVKGCDAGAEHRCKEHA